MGGSLLRCSSDHLAPLLESFAIEITSLWLRRTFWSVPCKFLQTYFLQCLPQALLCNQVHCSQLTACLDHPSLFSGWAHPPSTSHLPGWPLAFLWGFIFESSSLWSLFWPHLYSYRCFALHGVGGWGGGFGHASWGLVPKCSVLLKRLTCKSLCLLTELSVCISTSFLPHSPLSPLALSSLMPGTLSALLSTWHRGWNILGVL